MVRIKVTQEQLKALKEGTRLEYSHPESRTWQVRGTVTKDGMTPSGPN